MRETLRILKEDSQDLPMHNIAIQMNNKQRIEFLKNPHALLDQQSIRKIDTDSGSNQSLALISIQAAETMIHRGLFSDAKTILRDLLSNETKINEDTKGLALYHIGVALEGLEDVFAATQAFEDSYKIRQNGWPLFRLGKIHENTNPPLSYDYYSRAIAYNLELSDDASAYAETWVKSFFDESIYKHFNPDLADLNINLLNHYLEYGFKEQRIAGKAQLLKELARLKGTIDVSFDWKLYLNANPDLEALVSNAGLSLAEAEYALINHYISHGRDENRPLHQQINSSTKGSEALYNEYKDFTFRRASRELTQFLESNEKIRIGSDLAQEPLITIILVLFNKAELTLQALKSIQQSRYKDVALIAVDNNSSDSTRLLLNRIEGNVTLILNDSNLHFLESVNQALARVETKYVALLNNDAVLEYDTLDESIMCIKRFNDSAIVGGKVLHLDGYIQDAGSIVFEDGSCAGLGRRCTPNDHRYSFEREVDYVSGAYLLTTHKIFSSLGGFDEQFKPAYYEETDLCFRARSSGIPIVYSPDIVVKHLEYGSSSKSDSAVLLMERNQSRFKTIHAEALQKHLHPALFKEDQINSLMHGHLKPGPRVLFIDDRVPSLTLGSGFSRAYQLVTTTREAASHVTVFATDYVRSKSTTRRLPVGIECIEDSRDYFASILSSRSDFYDFIIVSREHNQVLFEQVRHELQERGVELKARIVYDVESLFTIRDYTKKVLDRTGEQISTLKGVDLAKIASKEIERLKKADAIISVSRFELDIIREVLPGGLTYFLGHSFEPIKPTPEGRRAKTKISFMGAIHERDSPNHDSLVWLYQDILPAVSDLNIKNLRVSIAGYIICKESLELIHRMIDEYSFVEYRGLVEDLGDFFCDSLLFLAPTRYAAGVPHKIHMASSYGVPTVTTTFVAQQIGWKDSESILVADTARDYAAAIENAYSCPSNFDNILENMKVSFDKDCGLGSFRENVRRLLQAK